MTLTTNGQATTDGPALETLEQHLEWVARLDDEGADLRPLVEILLREKFELREALEQVRAHQAALREEIEALCAPAFYPAVITAVPGGEAAPVEVASGNMRLQVAVHPNVPRHDLRVGMRGLLSNRRNCLLSVTETEWEWGDVATFEGHLPDHRRLLLRHQEHLLAVTAADDFPATELRKGDLVGFDRGCPRLAYRRIDSPGREDLFFEQTPSDRFEELGGLDEVIARLQWAVHFRLRHVEIADRYQLRAKRGILLEGPPGNGKTKLARCLARYIADLTPAGECRFMAIAGSSDYSMWLGQSEQRLIARFEAARDLATRGGVPVVMFFDEIDALGRRRGSDVGSGAPDRILATFLAQLDGVQPLANLIVVGATNRADILDPGLIRPGRLGDFKVRIPAPNRNGARAILNRYLGARMPLAEGPERLVQVLVSLLYSERGEYAEMVRVSLRDGSKVLVRGRDLVSGAMLENVVRTAAETAADREARTGQSGVTEGDLTTALEQELRSMTGMLTPANIRGYIPRLPQDIDPVGVEVLPRGPGLSRFVQSTAGTGGR
jgi:proteasome-associated ATPase